MKWTIPELKRKQQTDNRFSETVDLRDFIPEQDDILDISPVTVSGSYRIEADRLFHFDLVIEARLTIACARTLDPVEVPIHVEVVETFSATPHPDHRTIDGITVDLSPIIWSNIYLEKPLRVLKPGSTFESDTPSSEDKKTNPLFEALEKYKKG